MGRRCCVTDCCSRSLSSNTSVKFNVFGFPKDMKMRQKWVEALPKCPAATAEAVTPFMGVCELHFQDNLRINQGRKPAGLPVIFGEEAMLKAKHISATCNESEGSPLKKR